MIEKVLLYLIYGDRRAYHLELTYSVLSASRFLRNDPAGVRIVLIADEPNRRRDLPVEHLVINEETLKSWQMGGAYAHAAKPHALAYALQQTSAPTILMDSDTVLHAHPKTLFERVGPGRSLMHVPEGPLEQMQNWPDWKALIERSTGRLAGHPVNADSVMWNSGALGLAPQDAHLLDEIIAVIHEARAHSSVFTIEQLAAALVLDGPTQITACDDMVEHYWQGPRPYYHYQMARMFPSVLEGGGVEKHEHAFMPLRREPPVRRRDKLAARIKQVQRCADGAYLYAYLAYRSALSCAKQDPELANVWASTVLSMLSFGLRAKRSQTLRDFASFQPESLSTLDWMDSDLKKRWQAYWAVTPPEDARQA